MFETLDRINTNSKKWDRDEKIKDGLIPMNIADMDFEIAEYIAQDLQMRTNFWNYGYVHQSTHLYNSIISWQKKKNNWQIKKEWITSSPGVIAAAAMAILAFTNPGDDIIIQTPAYSHFYDIIEQNNRNVVSNPLKLKNGVYELDVDSLESLITSKTKLMIFCSPHNPTGRVWKQDEINKLYKVLEKTDVIIFSDEIFSDIIFSSNKHIVLANTESALKDRVITAMSPSKSFNLSGLSAAYTIISNENIRNKYRKYFENLGIDEINSFGVVGIQSAYEKGEEWLKNLISHLEINRDKLIDFFDKNKEFKVTEPEGTFMIWIDCSEIQKKIKPIIFFEKYCKIILSDGKNFGQEYDNFIRISYACSKEQIEEIILRISKGLKMWRNADENKKN